MDAVVRDYEIRSEGPIEPEESREIRVVVEKRCRTLRLSIDDGYSFYVEGIRFGGREMMPSGSRTLAAFCCEMRSIEIPAGGEMRFLVRCISPQGVAFRATIKVVEAEDVWSTDAWKVEEEVGRQQWGMYYQFDFGPTDLVAPGESIELLSSVVGDRFEYEGRWCEVPTKFDPDRVLCTGTLPNCKWCPVEATFTFKRYVRGDLLRVVAKNVGEYPARIYVTVFGRVPAGAWTEPPT